MRGEGRVQLEVFCPGLTVRIGGSGPLVSREGKAEEVKSVPGSDRDRVVNFPVNKLQPHSYGNISYPSRICSKNRSLT